MDTLIKDKMNNIFINQQRFFASFRTRDINFRKEALQKLKVALTTHTEAIYQALEFDLGKSKKDADIFEIGVVIGEINHALNHLDEWDLEETAEVDNFLKPSTLAIKREPFGVSYIIGPFNYPINLTFAPLIGAIVSGCTAIIKPSENTPACSAIIEKIINETFPADYLWVVQGAIEENSFLLSLPFNFIFFTGSPTVGKVVMKAAAEHLTPVVLELGGKCPAIICADADLEQTVRNITKGKFLNCGQTCVAPDYLLVDKHIKNELIHKLITNIEQHYFEFGSIGKIVTTNQLDKVLGYLSNTKGNKLCGGKFDKQLRYMQPIVVDNVTWDDALMQQELFAPVLPILTFDNVQTVHELVNQHHPHPLAAYVFTKNYTLGKTIIDRIPSGDAEINDVINHAASNNLPFGGLGASGMGEYHGKFSYQAFTHRKSIRITK